MLEKFLEGKTALNMKLKVTVIILVFTFALVAWGAPGSEDDNSISERYLEKRHRTKTVTVTKTVCASPTSESKLPSNKLKSFRDNKISEFCKRSKLRPINGTQNVNGVCSSTPQGEIPKAVNMPSTIILEPCNDAVLKAHCNFTVKVKTNSLTLGNFDDPLAQYNVFSQTLDSKGFILGHQHVTIQQLHSLHEPPDSTLPAFFKGLNDDGKGGVLTVVVDKLPPGTYRICTMSASFAHQPLVMPVAKRGSQDDCIRVTLK